MTQLPLSQLWTLFLSRFKVTVLITFFILLWGSVAFKALPREITPTIEIPAATITTIWPGASPGDVEKLITNKIEREIKGLENIKEYKSISLSGVSIVSIEFEIKSDMTENIQNIREKLDQVEPDLPSNIPDDPSLKEVSMSDVPILSLTLSGDFSWSELKKFSDILEDEFEGINLVKEVSVKGSPKDEIHILIDQIKLQAKGIGINEVIETIRNSHKDMPLGSISMPGQKVEVTVRAELKQATEFLELPLKVMNGSIIKLKEVASVRREFEKFEVETYFSDQEKSNPAVLIDVIKSASKGNVISMVEEVLGHIEVLKQSGTIPKTLNIATTYNRANDIQENLDTLTRSGSQTLILIALVMFIALGWREASLAAFSIPLSLLIAIIVLFLTDRTFNGVSLFALVLSIGLLVDNSIIIVEGISSGIHGKKLPPMQAAIHTLQSFRWPIITGTLTTVFAFLPMLFFISGVSGQYIGVLPVTVATVLLGALFVSLFLLPSIGANFYRIIPPKKHLSRELLQKTQKWYEHTMRGILASGQKISFVILTSFGLFIFSVWLVITSKVPIEVFPESDQTFFTAKIELPLGTEIEKTRSLIGPISNSLSPFFMQQENGDIFLENFVFTVGKASDVTRDAGEVSSRAEENVLGIAFKLTAKDEREVKSYEIMPIIEDAIEKAVPSQAQVRFSTLRHGPPTGSPIEIRLMGPDIRHLEEMAGILKSKIEKLPHTLNVRDSKGERTLQYAWHFDRDILAKFGLSPVQITQSLRSAVNGTTVIKLVEGDEEIDVDLRIDWAGQSVWDDPKSLDILKRIPIKTATGEFITLDQVANAEFSSEMSEIEHRDGLRVISVRSDLEVGITASQMENQLKTTIEELDRRQGEIIEIGGENEEGRRLMRESTVAMGFALIMILVVLVWQFNSFYQPIVTLLIIPLSLTGVFIGFWLSGMTITFPTMIGIVSLAGIIVNDAIVLIDRINKHLDQKMDWMTSIINSGKERMQPIFLTSITTVVGMLPLSLSDEVWGGLGFAIVYGMTLSTVLTLLLIPCFLAIGKK